MICRECSISSRFAWSDFSWWDMEACQSCMKSLKSGKKIEAGDKNMSNQYERYPVQDRKLDIDINAMLSAVYCIDCQTQVYHGSTCHNCKSTEIWNVGNIIRNRMEEQMGNEWVMKYRTIIAERTDENTKDLLLEIMEDIQFNTEEGEWKQTGKHESMEGVVEINPQSTALAHPLINDPGLTHHTDIIQQRKELIETEMIALAMELFTLSLYSERPKILVENCRFSVGLEMNNSLIQIYFYLKEVKKTERKKFTWLDLVRNVGNKTELPITWKSIRTKKSKSDLSIAGFSITDKWQVSDKNFSLDFIKLLPTARVLVQEELKSNELVALEDIAYLESSEEVSGHVE